MAHKPPGNLEPFWHNAGTELPMWFIQVDLQGHSRWIEAIDSWPTAIQIRKDFVRRLSDALKKFRFIQSHWAGDGGLFVAPAVATNTHKAVPAEDVLKAAYAAKNTFDKWRAKRPDCSRLGFRIGLHRTSIFIDNDPGNWFSNELNLFMKFERDLTTAGAISMTDEVYRRLRENAQHGWDPTIVKLGGAIYWKVYFNEPQKKMLNSTTFAHWLSKSIYAVPGSLAKELINHGDHIECCGDCLILVAPVSSVGFEDKIELEQLATAKWADGVPALSKSKHGDDFAKLCPIQIRAPMTDSPKMVIRYIPVWYKAARDFGRGIANDSADRLRFAKSALSLDRINAAVPDILCLHIVVIIEGRNASENWLVICQRATMEGQVDFQAGSWSVSIEEQYRPVVNVINGESEEHDTSIHECVVRGVQEELGFPDDVKPEVETHGLFVEADELLTAILAVARVRFSLKEFRKCVRHAVDRSELAAIFVMPFNKANVETLISSESIPLNFLESKGECIRGKFKPEILSWHTSSKLRLALSRWLLDADHDST